MIIDFQHHYTPPELMEHGGAGILRLDEHGNPNYKFNPLLADLPAHVSTYHSFSKLVLFAILFIVLILACMALGLVGNAGVFALMLGFGGSIALLVAFAVLG